MLKMQPARLPKYTAFLGNHVYQYHSKLSERPRQQAAYALYAARLLLRSMHKAGIRVDNCCSGHAAHHRYRQSSLLSLHHIPDKV